LATYGWNEDEPLFTFFTGAVAAVATGLVAGFAVAVAAFAVVFGAGLVALFVALSAGFAVLEVAMSFLKDGQKWIYENP
jgi:hypothetical protein